MSFPVLLVLCVIEVLLKSDICAIQLNICASGKKKLWRLSWSFMTLWKVSNLIQTVFNSHFCIFTRQKKKPVCLYNYTCLCLIIADTLSVCVLVVRIVCLSAGYIVMTVGGNKWFYEWVINYSFVQPVHTDTFRNKCWLFFMKESLNYLLNQFVKKKNATVLLWHNLELFALQSKNIQCNWQYSV